MNAGASLLPPAVLLAARRQAEALVAELAGVTAVVIATTDGFDVAAAGRTDVAPARLAALASSIAAIGEVVSAEGSLGRARCVTVETEAGFAVAQQVPRHDVPLVVQVLAGPDAVLGQVKYRAAASARELAAA